ncbi:MAG: hypothetical protein IPH57_00930 [Saprospiraceae bacterium]|nr:hypothetical protein [Saprospiraceae bacterium]
MEKAIKAIGKRKLLKKVLVTCGIITGVFVIMAFTLPFIFKGKVKELIKAEINKQIIAKADFGDVSLSFFKSFPRLNATVENLDVKGVGDFKDKELLSIKELSVDVNLISALFSSKPLEIVNFSVIEPSLNIIVNPDGKTNYNIFKDTQPEDESSDSKDINLNKYSMINGNLKYTDHQSLYRIIVSKLNHNGKGNFKARNFILTTKTDIEKLTYESSGIPMAKDLHINMDADIKVDLDQMLFEISENRLKINELQLVSVGKLKMNDSDIDIDMNIKAPGNNFKELFSLVPNAYIKDFKDVKAEGKFSFEGFVKGKYGLKTEEYPDFDFNIKADNGYVKYPSLSLPVEDINADIRIFKTGNTIGETNINIAPLSFSLAGESFLMKMLVSDLTTDPTTSGEIKGTLNLDALSRAFPMQDVQQLKGKIVTDIVFNVSKSLSKKSLKGNAEIENLNLAYTDMPALQISALKAYFNNDKILCTGISAKAGKSDFTGTLKIIDPLFYSIRGKSVTFDVDCKSSFVDADEWTSQESKSSDKTGSDDDAGMIDMIVNKFILKYKVQIMKLKFEDYDLKNITAVGNYQKNVLSLNNTSIVLSDSRMNISGRLNNIITWALEDKVLAGNLNIDSPHFDMDKFMAPGTDGKSATTEEEAFVLPDKMNLAINADIEKINYTGKEINSLKGNMELKDQSIRFNDLAADGMGGEMKLSGLFSAKDKAKPEYDFKLSLANMRYEEVYRQFVTFQALAPVVKFLNGFFNADFNLKGKLNEDMSPQLETINAAGLVQTINGYIRSFAGTNEIAEKLNIQSIKNIKLENIKGRFEILNGILKVNPFDVKFDDMNFNISGTNKLDKTIDYIVHAKIPKSKIDKIPAGQNINKGLNFLTSQAKAKGLDINLGETINLDILLSGPVFKPKLKFEYRGNEGEALKTAVQNKVDNVAAETKTKVNQELEKRKTEAENKAKEVIDSTKKKVESKANETLEDLKKKAQKELENKLDSTTKKKANDVLNQYNPFKKKK